MSTDTATPAGDNSAAEDMDGLRKAIDAIDEQILDLICTRLETARKIGAIKAKNGGPVFDSAREALLLSRLNRLNRGPLSTGALHYIFKEIIAASREIQKPVTVAYLGPEGTFTHLATLNHFGRGVQTAPLSRIRDIFAGVDKEIYPFGVVPVENSIEGAVNPTLDLFWESEVQICAEIYQTISHDLLSTAKTLEDIEVLYSHSQAFAQCREWIGRHLPNCRLVPCESTALAAQKALENPRSGAIAGREAARIYQLPIAASRIEDSIRNTTRFLVIGKKMPGRTEQDKTSLLFATHHVPGALYKVLKPINDAGLNMVKLESRPSRHENWSYHFFVDIEGHLEDAPVQQAVDEMNKMCMMLKCLGSYPRA